MITRRDFLALSAAAGVSGLLKATPVQAAQGVRRYHCCLGSKILEARPELLDIVKEAGVTDIWLASYFFGHWYEKPKALKATIAKVEAKGLGWNIINVPLGHPGDALGDATGATPIMPPTRWQMAVKVDGTKYSGTSLHPPGTRENVDAVKEIAVLKPGIIFLDDDFRLARGPGVIGGCFCEWHKRRFLDKYGHADTPFRVGEMMFHDRDFGRLSGKTGELFSAIFHRRYARSDLAYSETTAYPADQLSAKNMAAKLAVSTITDVRNTMFMSGMTPFPVTHWETLAPAMKKQAAFHEQLKGHSPQGPFKHYWGEASRYVGNDKPFSIFLASGIPFEVTDSVSTQGWTFLSDQDARYLSPQEIQSTRGKSICRPDLEGVSEAVRTMPDTLDALWKLKAEVIADGLDVPYVTDEKPTVCAWYPSARKVFLWNLSETKEIFQLEYADKTIPVTIDGLDSALIAV